MNKRISVIIPIYNSAATLERTLKSVLDQSYTNLEILLINDGSTDNSLDICLRYQSNDSRIRIINQSNQGVGEARNKGIDLSTGDYISFVDSDDILDKDFYLTLINSARITNADIVESGARVILPGEVDIYPYAKKNNINIFDGKGYMENYLNFSLNVSVWGKIYKREIIGNTRFPKLNINEDFIFLWEIVKKTKLFCENLDVNYHYYLNNEMSLSKSPFNKNNMSMLLHIDDVVNDVKKKYPDLLDVAINHYNACLLHTLILYYHYINSESTKELYLSERDEMLKRARSIKKITSYLLLHESAYDIPQLLDSIVEISEKKKELKI